MLNDTLLLPYHSTVGKRKEKNMEDMTDKQFDKILKMVSMILDGCEDLEEAKAKFKELTDDQKKEKSAE